MSRLGLETTVVLGSSKIIAKACCWLLVYQLGACSCGCFEENLWYRGAQACLNVFTADAEIAHQSPRVLQPSGFSSAQDIFADVELQFVTELPNWGHPSHDHSDCECQGRPHYFGTRFVPVLLDAWQGGYLEFSGLSIAVVAADWYQRGQIVAWETASYAQFHSLLASPISATLCRLQI